MSDISRRSFLWITGGSSIALATNPPRKLVNKLIPKVVPPEDIRPGAWQFYATTCRECPAGCGMQVWHRDGRVTKAEGNPDHPVNRGGLCPRGQSALQGLYDPDRVQRVLFRARGDLEAGSWEQAFTDIAARLSAGGRVAVLSSLQTGALSDILKGFARSFGSGRVLFYEPFNYEPLRAAHQQLFGLPVIPSYRLDTSNFIISFSADFLESWVSPVSFAQQFSAMHGYRGGARMNRMAYVGPRLSLTAANADQFLQVPPGYERVVAAWMLKIMMDQGWHRNDISPLRGPIEALTSQAGPIPGVPEGTLVQLAHAFSSAPASVALGGPVAANSALATDTALCAALLNYAAGRIGQTVDFSRPHALSAAAREQELERFFASLSAQDVLFVLDANPVYGRLEAAAQLGKAGLVVYLGTMMDETAQTAHWFLPVDSPLESWGEYQPYPGVNGLMQPTLARLYDSRAAGDVFLELARRAGRPIAGEATAAPSQDFAGRLKARWEGMGIGSGASGAAESPWEAALSKGGSWHTEAAAGGKGVAAPRLGSVSFAPGAPPPGRAGEVELWPWASIMTFDGRVANRGWLQEAPDPITFLVWGNWIDLHPDQAKELGIADGDHAELKSPVGAVRARVRVTEEVSRHVAALGLGQGHRALGNNARGIGVNAFALFGAQQTGSTFARCQIRRVADTPLATPVPTERTREQHERDILQWIRLSGLSRMQPGQGDELILPLPEGYRPDKDLYPKREYTKHRWAMVIDLQRCIGCGACAVACYAENNIPVVGRERVVKGREMAWLRVAPYRKPDQPLRIAWLPLLCQHCDAAPCEPVCPVFAAMHNEEGLNAQIYNRCIGTRYCSNNCPYKVRRFNWVNVRWQAPLDLQLNPEVTVRSRGVMEKCTFCVQRIRQAEYQAQRERRRIRDGEIQPACAQSCPARVFTFGDLLDPSSQVSRLTREDPRRYHVLEDLNTKPAVTYLRRVEVDSEG